MQKKAYPSENQISKEEKQRTSQNGGYRKTSLRKVSEKSGKVKFPTKDRQSVLSSSILFVRMNYAC